MTRVITIRLEIPDDVEVRWDRPTDDEPIPLPAWPEPAPIRRTEAASAAGSTGWCPVHGAPWRTVPAGVSRKTGRPYGAFLACPEPGCGQRPPDRERGQAV